MGDGSVMSTAAAETALSVAKVSLPADFPLVDGGTGDAFTAYVRIRTQSTAVGANKDILTMTDAALKGWAIYQTVTTDDRKISAYIYNVAGGGFAIVSATVADHTNFHSVALRYKGDTDNEVSMWLNGAKDVTTDTITTTFAVDNAFFIGNQANDGTRAFSGYIDEAAVWSRALTDTEMLSLHLKGVNSFVQESIAATAAAVALAAAVAKDLESLGGLSGTSTTIKQEFGV